MRPVSRAMASAPAPAAPAAPPVEMSRLLWCVERARLGRLCSSKYPFEDMSVAAAIRDQRGAPYSSASFGKTPVMIKEPAWLAAWLWLRWVVRFVASVLIGSLPAVAMAAARPASFGVELLSQDTGENVELREAVRRAVGPLRPSRFLATGDLRTLGPFLAFGMRDVLLDRFWLRVPSSPAPNHSPSQRACPLRDDDEAVALDVSWPSHREKESDQPTYLVLHGLNGGSDEKYIRDFILRANASGAVAAVLINRGCMRTLVRGTSSIFSGARTCDVSAAVEVLAAATERPVAVVGFSMGGIIAANYAVAAGADSQCVAAVCVSGSLCTAKTLEPCGDRARKVWHPPLVHNLKHGFFVPAARKLAIKQQHKSTQRQLLKKKKISNASPSSSSQPGPAPLLADVWRAATIDQFDRAFVCGIHDYDDLEDYYRDVSAAGLADPQGIADFGAKLRTPLLVIHARDDPIVPFDTIMPHLLVPKSPKLTVLATKVGGHVGWPAAPFRTRRWDFMIQASLAFAETAAARRRRKGAAPEAAAEALPN